MSYLGTHQLAYFAKYNIKPTPPPECIQPASIDLHLSNRFVELSEVDRRAIWLDPRTDNSTLGVETEFGHPVFAIPPHGFALGATIEDVQMPTNNVGRIEGKSSLGRLGLQVHVTAGFIDPGFKGQITLEFHNLLPIPWILYVGMPICQLSVAEVMDAEPYTGKYQGESTAPQQSRYHQNYRDGKWK